MNNGQYQDAMDEFISLEDYKDSSELKDQMYAKIIANVTIGDVLPVTFGNYKEKPLEWIVLTKNGNEALLVTKQVIGDVEYNEEFESITWENCSLRAYLNNDFIKNTFSSEEQSKIKQVKLKNKDNETYGTPGGDDTTDRVFLLSIDEVNEYFSSDSQRCASSFDGDSRLRLWWLRSPGYSGADAALVGGSGEVVDSGLAVSGDSVGIRPALWLNLEP